MLVAGLSVSCAADSLCGQDGFEPRQLPVRQTLRPLPTPSNQATPSPQTPAQSQATSAVQQVTYADEGTESSRLNWRRRDTQTSGTATPGFTAPRNSSSGTRVASSDPINDPFGDRRGQSVPARPVSLEPRALPVQAPTLQRPQVPGAGYLDDDLIPRRERTIDCSQLSSSPITSIEFTLAPSLFPGGSEDEREIFRSRLKELITNPVRTWTSTDPTVPPVEGRFVDFINEKTLVVQTTDNRQVRMELLTNESFDSAKILKYNVEQDWVDKSGRVVARGWFIDYINDSILIRTVDGEDVRIRYNDLATGSLATVTELWELPHECGVPESGSMDRNWIAHTYTWKASALCHKPLYFEDIQLERYGHSAGPFLQPLRSGAHFFLNIAALPYNVGVYPPNECRYALGYYRPGNCAPFRGYALPLSARGALTATGFYVGAPMILP